MRRSTSIHLLLTCLTSLVAAGSAVAALPEQKPNIVFILADDLGQRDLGCYGSTFYETPHLDQLAKEGALFTDAYAACQVCSPTRASIMIGQWPARCGITEWIGARSGPKDWKRNTQLISAPYRHQLEHDEITLAEAMKSAGYATFFAGKWHLGPEGWWPEDQGFDINMGGNDRGSPPGGKRYFSPYGNPRLPDGSDGEHLPDRLATETCKFIAEHSKQPFFAYLSFYSVHTPLMARDDLRQKYEEKRKSLQLEDKWGTEEFSDLRLVQSHAVYAAMVEAMDQAVGRVLAKLDELNLRENTLVIFTSDNGGLATSEGWPTSNLPLRGGKGWMYEGGIREPLLMRWPEVIPAGMVCDTPVSSPDFFPTLLDAVGAKPARGQILDGVSLLPLFEGKDLPDRSLYWHYPHYSNQGGFPAAAIRRGNWKLIQNFETNQPMLFNLAKDPGEQNDVAADHPEIVNDLLADLQSWQKEMDARFPTPNPDFHPDQKNGRTTRRRPVSAK